MLLLIGAACNAGQKRMNSMGYLGMVSVPIPRLPTESADAAEVDFLLSNASFLPLHS